MSVPDILDIICILFSILALYIITGYYFSITLTDEKLLNLISFPRKRIDNIVFVNVDLFEIGFYCCLAIIFPLLCILQIHWGLSVAILIGISILLAFILTTPYYPGDKFFYPLRKLLSVINTLVYRLYPDNVKFYQKTYVANMFPNESLRKKTMLKDIIHFGKETVKDILTAHVDVVDIDSRTPFSEVLKVIAQNKYSRIPVYSNTKDNIIGILYIKDLLPYLNKPANFHWQSLIRPYICVPETKKIDNLLHEFQSKKIHLAVVVDEYGGIAGVVTLEDIIEEIVGEINDEFDDDKNPYIKISSNTYIFDAKISLQDFCKTFNIDDTFFEEFGEDINTLASLVIDIIGDIPHKHQVVRYKLFVFEILSSDERHISKVKVTRF